MHTVVWTLDSKEADRTGFLVGDDRGELADLLKELQTYRETGQTLLDDLPDDNFVEWDKRAKMWAALLEGFFNKSPHLGSSEAEQLAIWGGEPRESQQDSAAAAIAHRLERIDWNIERFSV